jgi:hypothetical protein
MDCLPDSDTLSVKYSNFVDRGGRSTAKEGSHADFLMKARTDESAFAVTMAVKHLGMVVYERAFPELEWKVRTHYCDGAKSPRRIGFSEGVSPYLPFIERNLGSSDLPEMIVRVDLKKRCVTTSRRTIFYDRLISTVPLRRFLELADVDCPIQTEAGGGHFVSFATDEGVVPNHLIYDTDSLSPIYRTFAPRPEIIVAQVAVGHWSESADVLALRLQQFLDLRTPLRLLGRVTIDECYPLRLSDYTMKAELVETLSRAGVTLFGRFAEWTYRDLEELDWAAIV